MNDLLALVRINEGVPMFATADIVWPGEQLGEWSLEVEGDYERLGTIFFAREIVQVRFVVFSAKGLAAMHGKAQPVSLNRPTDLNAKASLRLAGDGELVLEETREGL